MRKVLRKSGNTKHSLVNTSEEGHLQRNKISILEAVARRCSVKKVFLQM